MAQPRSRSGRLLASRNRTNPGHRGAGWALGRLSCRPEGKASGVGRATVTETVDLAAVWTAATDLLHDEIVSQQRRAYLRLTSLRAIVEDTALLAVPDAYTREVIETQLRQ